VSGKLSRVAAGLVGCIAAVAIVAGCGESVELPDLFIVKRSGSVPGAYLTLLVNEGGAVRCNGGPTRQLSDPQLVLARGIQEELQSPSAKHLSLPPRPGSVFDYYVRDAEGTVRFADNSSGQSSAMRHLAYFVLEVEQQVCHLPA
jgi:hypothetical protein